MLGFLRPAPHVPAQQALPEHSTCERYLLRIEAEAAEKIGDKKPSKHETLSVNNICHFLLIIFTYFMQQICLLSCYLNIDTFLNIAYGGLSFQGTLEAMNSKENFKSDVFMLNICINGYVCLYLSYCDFHRALIVSLRPIIFETDIS